MNGTPSKHIATLVLAFSFLAGCVAPSQVLLKNDTIEKPFTYEVSKPSSDWKFVQEQNVHNGLQSTIIQDFVLTKCPGIQFLSVRDVKFNPNWTTFNKDELRSNVNLASLYLQDSFWPEKDNDLTVTSSSETAQYPYPAVEMEYQTTEKLTSCDEGAEPTIQPLMNKSIIFDARPGATGTWWHYGTIHLIEIRYTSPEPYFQEGSADLEKFAQSFRFTTSTGTPSVSPEQPPPNKQP